MFWKKNKKKKLRQLNLSQSTWVKIGEIYSHALVNGNVSLSNENIVEKSIEILHKKIVIDRSLDK